MNRLCPVFTTRDARVGHAAVERGAMARDAESSGGGGGGDEGGDDGDGAGDKWLGDNTEE